MDKNSITIYIFIICISIIIGQYVYQSRLIYDYIVNDDIYLYKLEPGLDMTRSESGKPISEIIVNY